MGDVVRRNWRFWVTLAEVLILTAFFAHYIAHRQNVADSRQRVADARAERQRAAICAILANVPGHIPPEMGRARAVFARPGHPGECEPIRPPTSKPTPAPTVTPRQTVILQPGPTVTRTARPASRPSATPTKRPSPSPTPSRTCVPLTSICTH